MAAVVQILLEVDADGATRAFNSFTGEAAKLGPALGKTGSSGNLVMTGLRKQTEQAHDAARLLSRTLGVEMPRQLDKFLASSSVLGPALASAFNVAIVAAFGAVVLQQIPKIAEFATMLGGMTAEYKALEEAARKASNAALMGFATPEEGAKIQRMLQRQIEDLSLASEHFVARMTFGAPGVAGMRALDHWFGSEEERAKKIAELTAMSEEIAKRGKEIADRHREEEKQAAKKHGEEQLAREKSVADGVEQLWKMSLDNRLAGYEAFQKEREALDKKMEEAVDSAFLAMEKEAEFRREKAKEQLRIVDEVTTAENAAAIAVLPSWEQTYAQIVESARQREQQVRESAAQVGMDEQQVARIVAADWAVAGAQIRNQLAGDLESAFDDMLSGRLWQRILKQFEHMVFQMIAQWILGQRAMQAATTGGASAVGGGGFSLSGILGGLFGLGGGGSSSGGALGMGSGPFGVNTTFPSGGFSVGGSNLTSLGASAAGMGSLTGLPLSAGGGGSGLGGVLPAGAMSLGAGGGGLSGFLASGGGFGLAGAGLLAGGRAIGFGSPLRGALSGAMMGAGGVGLAIGALMGPLSGMAGSMTALGALAGPWGLAIVGVAALIGALFGLSGRKKKQKQCDEIERQAFAQIKIIEDSYNFHQMDYLSARQSLEQLREQVNQSMRQLGWASRMDPHIDAAIQRMNTTEAERQRRAQLQFGPAQFSQGGVVSQGAGIGGQGAGFGPLGISLGGGGSYGRAPLMAASYDSGGAIPIIAHIGEGVVTRRGMRSLGRAGLDSLNRGGAPSFSAGGVTVVVNVNAIDKGSVQAWLRDGGMDEISRAARRARAEGAM